MEFDQKSQYKLTFSIEFNFFDFKVIFFDLLIEKLSNLIEKRSKIQF